MLNKVFLLGRLGADPELRYSASQMPICNLRIATNERKKTADGNWEEVTEWHSVVTFGKTAENCSQYLAKGRQAFVEGKLSTSKWQDKDGNDRYKTEIIANNVTFVGGNSKGTNENIERSYQKGSSVSNTPMPDLSADISFDDDDIPF